MDNRQNLGDTSASNLESSRDLTIVLNKDTLQPMMMLPATLLSLQVQYNLHFSELDLANLPITILFSILCQGEGAYFTGSFIAVTHLSTTLVTWVLLACERSCPAVAAACGDMTGKAAIGTQQKQIGCQNLIVVLVSSGSAGVKVPRGKTKSVIATNTDFPRGENLGLPYSSLKKTHRQRGDTINI